MAGTSKGGLRARDTVFAKYGQDFYKNMGAMGGSKAKTGGFWHRKYVLGDTDYISNMGRLGGSRRKGKSYPKQAGLQGEEYLPLPNSYAGKIQIEIPDLP